MQGRYGESEYMEAMLVSYRNRRTYLSHTHSLSPSLSPSPSSGRSNVLLQNGVSILTTPGTYTKVGWSLDSKMCRIRTQCAAFEVKYAAFELKCTAFELKCAAFELKCAETKSMRHIF